MFRRHGNILTLLLLLLWTAPFESRADGFLAIEVWCELEPIVYDQNAHFPLTEEEAYRRMFEEARQIFSGMIYGYSFTYIPGDRARGVKEEFILEPVAMIEWGDPNLTLIQRTYENNRFYGRFTYELAGFQEKRIASWRTIAIPTDSGKGEGQLILGLEGKRLSRVQAVKYAVRNLLRPALLNKPREVRGRVLLLEGPETVMHAGMYITNVKVKIDVTDVVPYRVY
ncbi:MAG TPA: hypothetical protein ENN69_00295 [Spirochaetia bacterium]|nr:hypothetical protein [Spirochaetia bacterium]